MIGRGSGPALEGLRRVFDFGAVGGLSDGQLLERFVSGPDRAGEEAFAALVERHGPTVLGVCRRFLGDPHAADDAFQATFLVLARRAPSISGRDRVGNWLYGVALRVSREARARDARRRSREAPLGDADVAIAATTAEPSAEELRSAVVEELARLPDRFRGPVLLCDLEGLSRRDAADRLGLPEGTISSRLARGRDLLRGRLVRRGMAPAVVTAATAFSRANGATAPAIPSRLIESTSRSAARWVSGGPGASIGGGLASTTAAALARGVLMTMTMTMLAKLTAASLAVLTAIGAGLALAARHEAQAPDPGRPAARDEGQPPDSTEAELTGIVRDADGQPSAGATVVVGVWEGDGGPLQRLLRNHGARPWEGDEATHRLVLRTDAGGRFSAPRPPSPFRASIAAAKEGYAGTMTDFLIDRDEQADPIDLQLSPAEPFEAALVDREGRPIVGAEVRIEVISHRLYRRPLPDGGSGPVPAISHIRWEFLQETPLESAFSATTAEDGRFSLPILRQYDGLRLLGRAPDGRLLRIDLGAVEGWTEMTSRGFLPVVRGRQPRLIAMPAARIAGRVVGRVPGVDVEGLFALIQPVSRSEGARHPYQTRLARVDASGHFTIEGLEPGAVNVMLRDMPEGATWASRAADSVELDWDRRAEAVVELVDGVLVRGRVVDEDGRPVSRAYVGHHGPDRPRSGAAITRAETDDDGRYGFRLAPGEHLFYINDLPEGYIRLEIEGSGAGGAGSRQTVTIAKGVETFEVPPISVARP